MQFHSTTTMLYLCTTFSRYFSSSSSAKLPKLQNLSKVPSRYRLQAIQEAQMALTDYLHTTKTLPFTYAENISKNSLFSLSEVIARVKFSPTEFRRSLQKFLSFHPINEFEFFYESIGINYDEIGEFLPVNKFFLSEDYQVFSAACVLSGFGFPWNKLGLLYKEEISIFGIESRGLNERLIGFKKYGFNNVMIIGICLAFPFVLSRNPEMGGEIDALFDDFKRVFVDFDLVSSVDENVDAWHEVCRKIRVFYDLGCRKGKLGELMGRNKNIFLDHTEEVLIQKIEFFSKLVDKKDEIGLLLLSRSDILKLDIDNTWISVSRFLEHCELEEFFLTFITQKYPYVLGRNRLANLPHVLRSLDLNEWFFNKIKNGDHHVLCSYVIHSCDEDSDKDFTDNLMRIQSSRTALHTLCKLKFLHGIGFGENQLTIKVLTHLHGTSNELQERFDCLIRSGIEFSKLCKMISTSPKILNQQADILKQKVKFLCQDIGSSLQYLDVFPAYLCYDLEKRIKPRYRFHMWLTENRLSAKEYSLSSMIATSEKSFIARIYGIHPAAPKKWLESYLNKDPGK